MNDKEEFWQSLSDPLVKGCGNCKYLQCNLDDPPCSICWRHKIIPHESWHEDNWVWDGRTIIDNLRIGFDIISEKVDATFRPLSASWTIEGSEDVTDLDNE